MFLKHYRTDNEDSHPSRVYSIIHSPGKDEFSHQFLFSIRKSFFFFSSLSIIENIHIGWIIRKYLTDHSLLVCLVQTMNLLSRVQI